MREVAGRRARIFAAGLPPAHAERLIEEAERFGPEFDEPCALLRWRFTTTNNPCILRSAKGAGGQDALFPHGQRRAVHGDEHG